MQPEELQQKIIYLCNLTKLHITDGNPNSICMFYIQQKTVCQELILDHYLNNQCHVFKWKFKMPILNFIQYILTRLCAVNVGKLCHEVTIFIRKSNNYKGTARRYRFMTCSLKMVKMEQIELHRGNLLHIIIHINKHMQAYKHRKNFSDM